MLWTISIEICPSIHILVTLDCRVIDTTIYSNGNRLYGYVSPRGNYNNDNYIVILQRADLERFFGSTSNTNLPENSVDPTVNSTYTTNVS